MFATEKIRKFELTNHRTWAFTQIVSSSSYVLPHLFFLNSITLHHPPFVLSLTDAMRFSLLTPPSYRFYHPNPFRSLPPLSVTRPRLESGSYKVRRLIYWLILYLKCLIASSLLIFFFFFVILCSSVKRACRDMDVVAWDNIALSQ